MKFVLTILILVFPLLITTLWRFLATFRLLAYCKASKPDLWDKLKKTPPFVSPFMIGIGFYNDGLLSVYSLREIQEKDSKMSTLKETFKNSKRATMYSFLFFLFGLSLVLFLETKGFFKL